MWIRYEQKCCSEIIILENPGSLRPLMAPIPAAARSRVLVQLQNGNVCVTIGSGQNDHHREGVPRPGPEGLRTLAGSMVSVTGKELGRRWHSPENSAKPYGFAPNAIWRSGKRYSPSREEAHHR